MLQLTILADLEEKVTETSLENYYEYFLAVSTDTLVVLNSKLDLEKVIIQGKDNDAFVCACTDINHFLESLAILEEMIINRINPLNSI